MIHALHRVTDFRLVGPYRLRVEFRDGSVQEIDFEPVLAGALFGPLRDQSLFNRVRLDPEVHTLVWPNGADFDPATLHDWPEMLPALLARVRSWADAEETVGGTMADGREGAAAPAGTRPVRR